MNLPTATASSTPRGRCGAEGPSPRNRSAARAPERSQSLRCPGRSPQSPAAPPHPGVRATSKELVTPADTLERANEYLWRGCTGDQFADLCQLSLNQDTSQITFSSAGSAVVLQITGNGIRELGPGLAGPELGVMDYGEYENQCCVTQKDEFLIVLTENGFAAVEGDTRQAKIKKIQRNVGKGSRLSAADMIKRLRKLTLNLNEEDASIVVIKRLG